MKNNPTVVLRSLARCLSFRPALNMGHLKLLVNDPQTILTGGEGATHLILGFCALRSMPDAIEPADFRKGIDGLVDVILNPRNAIGIIVRVGYEPGARR